MNSKYKINDSDSNSVFLDKTRKNIDDIYHKLSRINNLISIDGEVVTGNTIRQILNSSAFKSSFPDYSTETDGVVVVGLNKIIDIKDAFDFLGTRQWDLD